MKNDKKKIKYILENFDFKKVAQTMSLLNWTWTTTEPKTPSVAELKKTAKELLRNVRKYDPKESYAVFACGGLWAHRINGVFTLSFIVTEFDSEYWDEEQDE